VAPPGDDVSEAYLDALLAADLDGARRVLEARFPR
jgi:hypothetical protein